MQPWFNVTERRSRTMRSFRSAKAMSFSGLRLCYCVISAQNLSDRCAIQRKHQRASLANLARILDSVAQRPQAHHRGSQASTASMTASTNLPPSGPRQIASPADDARQDRKTRCSDQDALFLPRCLPSASMKNPRNRCPITRGNEALCFSASSKTWDAMPRQASALNAVVASHTEAEEDREQ